MDGYEEWVEAFLVEDQRMPRKQRRTAKAIYKTFTGDGFTRDLKEQFVIMCVISGKR